MAKSIKIGIIGDFDPDLRSHLATKDALKIGAGHARVALDYDWLPTLPLEAESNLMGLKTYDALWCAPGSPYKSLAGALKAIRFARERGWPFFGT